jgi:hypothetical protein
MPDFRIALDSVALDESGQVVLNDDELEAQVGEADLMTAAGANWADNVGCTNARRCDNTFNDGCTNTQHCDGTINVTHSCTNGYT